MTPDALLTEARELEKKRPLSLCDPECEGRCRVCPND